MRQLTCSNITIFSVVSIHAPTRGATDVYANFADYYRVSIHAPTRGATKVSATTLLLDLVSIHAPTRGATDSLSALYDSSKFQSTHPRGVRLIIVYIV